MINFQLAKYKAYSFLLEQEQYSLPLDTSHLLWENTPLILESIQNYEKLTGANLSTLSLKDKLSYGFVTKKRGFFLIFYNEKHFDCVQYWTKLHEVGHLSLSHIQDGDTEEVEANFFTQQVAMPDCFVRYLYYNNVPIHTGTLMQIFGVSYDAAFKTVTNLRNCFISSEMDEELINKYSGFLENVVYDYAEKKIAEI